MSEKSVNLVLVVHNHQPVGNFDHVFSQAADEAYLPFLRALIENPAIRVGLHTSGCLWDWLTQNREEYLELARELAGRGQIEFIGGGYYEPVISLLPRRDVLAQFERMNRFLFENFGVVPEGFWCTERVWNPALPYFLEGTGAKYTLLDDNHFISAGLTGKKLEQAFRTAYLDSEISLLPIGEKMRYLIPFKLVPDIEAYFREKASENPSGALIFGDDGEKFGVWPGTAEWVWTKGWMNDFIAMLSDNSDWINLKLPAEYLKENPPRDSVFLPSTSYREMTGWALPPVSAREYEEGWERLKPVSPEAPEKRFYRGGYFENYLTKYTETAAMHRELLYVSKLLERTSSKLEPAIRAEAEKHLHMAQCNCAYWHGIFGGLYLNYLRNAVYRNYAAAKKYVFDHAGLEPCEIAGGYIRLTNRELALELGQISGAIEAVDFLPSVSRITDVITRRYEAYHEKIAESEKQNVASHESIHDGWKMKEGGLLDRLHYDRTPRRSFEVQFAEPGISAKALCENGVNYLDEPNVARWSHVINDGAVIFKSSQNIAGAGNADISKRIALSQQGARIFCELEINLENAPAGFECDVIVTWNFGLLAGDAPDRYFLLRGGREKMLYMGEEKDASTIALADEWQGFHITISTQEPCDFLVYPIETVSASEGGLERTYQGSSVNLVRRMSSGGGTFVWKFEVGVVPII